MTGVPNGSAQGCTTDANVENLRDVEYHFDPLLMHLLHRELVVVSQDWSRLPTIPQFWIENADGLCPLEDFASYLDVSLSSDMDFLAAAWAIAQTTDEAVMGIQTFEGVKEMTRTDNGAEVVLLAKSAATGLLVEWTADVAFNGAGSATWEALEIVPGLRSDWHGWFIWPGETGPKDDNSVQVTKTRLYPTHDGKNIRVTYFTQNYVSEAAADLDADHNGNGGVNAYDTYEVDWGFSSADPDNFMDITVDGCACIYSGNQVNIHMPPNVRDWINAILPGLHYDDAEGTVWDIVGHEMFHHMQYCIMQWNAGGFVIEGQARATETILTPEFSHLPGSLHFLEPDQFGNGFIYFYKNPHLPPASFAYSYGPVWGHMYDTNGVDSLRLVLEAIDTSNQFPGYMDAGLAADTTGDHDTYRDLLVDLAPRLAAHDLTYPKYDGSVSFNWMQYSPPVPQTSVPGNAWALPGTSNFGFRFGNFADSPGSDAAAVAVASADWATGIVSKETTGWQHTDAPGLLSDTANVIGYGVRVAPSAGPVNVPGLPLVPNQLQVHYV